MNSAERAYRARKDRVDAREKAFKARRLLAYLLHVNGATFEKIGEKLGVNRQTAYSAVAKYERLKYFERIRLSQDFRLIIATIGAIGIRETHDSVISKLPRIDLYQ